MRNSYIKAFVFATVLATLAAVLSVAGSAQTTVRGLRLERKSPRAIGVLEIDQKGGGSLYPVSIWIDGKLYDAGFYISKPVPMALWTDTLYEAQQHGMPVGTFTLRSGRRTSRGWLGEGTWNPLPSGAAEPTKGDDKKPASSVTVPGADDPDRPVFHRPKRDDAPAPGDKTQAGTSGDAKSAPPQSRADEKPSRPSEPIDPNAPVLRRNPNPTRPSAESVESKPGETVGPAAKLPETLKPAAVYAAVSDPEPTNNRPLEYLWGDEQERAKQMAAVQQLAISEIKKAATARRLTLPAKIDLKDVAVQVFDLDYSNSPQFIFTGRVPVPVPGVTGENANRAAEQNSMVVTLVARMNFQGELMKLYSAVSDPRDLDDRPVMRFIDAVDADGDGRSELLFDRGLQGQHQYVLFRIAGLSMSEMFATARR